jgi:hypothetical protein
MRLDDWGFILGRDRDFLLSSRPDRFWGPPSLLSNKYRGLFPPEETGRGVKVTTHLHLVPRKKSRHRDEGKKMIEKSVEGSGFHSCSVLV